MCCALRVFSDARMPPFEPTEPRLDFVTCAHRAGTHRMAYWEWGEPGNPRVLVCVHGLTRSGRDFDVLARHVSAHYRVVCPDVVGRGKSDWLTQPQHYTVTQYVADMLTLIARLNVTTLDWVGTSMGGLIGLGLAGALAASAAARQTRAAHGLPAAQTLALGKIVLNDIGPNLDATGLARIAGYVGQPVVCNSFAQAVDTVRQTAASFGPHSQAQWEDLTRHVFVQEGDVWVKHYDLRIAEPMQSQNADALRSGEALLWAAYASLSQPVLIIRGRESDLLTAHTAQAMLQRNRRAQLYEVEGVGHAPSLMQTDQVQRVADFLLGDMRAAPAAR